MMKEESYDILKGAVEDALNKSVTKISDDISKKFPILTTEDSDLMATQQKAIEYYKKFYHIAVDLLHHLDGDPFEIGDEILENHGLENHKVRIHEAWEMYIHSEDPKP